MKDTPDYFPEEWQSHQPSSLPDSIEVPDYFDYIFAFRQWKLCGDKLESLNGELWVPHRRMEAACTMYQRANRYYSGTPFGSKVTTASSSTNEYDVVNSVVFIEPGKVKGVVDTTIWADSNTTSSIIQGKKPRNIPMGAGMRQAFTLAQSGTGSAAGYRHTDAMRRLHEVGHPPIEGCTCGIYATRTLKLLTEKARWNKNTAFVGIVKMWGVGYEGSMGYRFQYAYPDMLFTREEKHIDTGQTYGVPVFLVKDYEDLFDRFGHIER